MDTDLPRDFIELKTLPFPIGKRKEMSQQKKKGFKGIFGQRRTSNTAGQNSGNSKYDVVRSVEGLQYTKTIHEGYELTKDIKKESYLTPRTAIKNGHRFDAHTKPTWCDVCEEFIWGLYTQAVRCQYCRYTCHEKCVSDVDLECPKAVKSREELTKETLKILNDVTDGSATMARKNNNLPTFVSSITELRKLINEYNENSSLIMTLHDDYTFDGFVRVHMNLSRPVNVSSDVNLTLKKAVAKKNSTNRKSISDIFSIEQPQSSTLKSRGEASGSSSHNSTMESATMKTAGERRGRPSRRLSFYMPRGTYKPLHVTSQTTAREVIEALLSKYNVTDNPRKFSLYEQTQCNKHGNENEVIYRRLHEDEKPLVLRLSWGVLKSSTKSFALKENEDGKVQWENFEIPELHNFLTILQLEEDEMLAQIYVKYENYKEALKKALEIKKN